MKTNKVENKENNQEGEIAFSEDFLQYLNYIEENRRKENAKKRLRRNGYTQNCVIEKIDTYF